ncbi:leucine-rich repeat and calponin homology domain-containing protein 1 isoform X2 [Callorhinchus milii]|uniref:leucine-rich repeat and calponin homology domain-containing protein 1 isoform X2 n=1 Tax=Callorhinchus milii TaxID=7868 RepID=UPI0004576024|nr:leucine-rich repeat and calponin homology domain-containing protein 1 isoform X2 [Callorhinchus milii]|eukprot:gi/632949078/ref/XP_007889949.1/ PREDICTED: leucine-rich repeat and calponin homology domain-containing protein 1 isoform X2 [Callorhinchus milii]
MMAAPVSRSVERAVEEAAASGSLSLSGRKLKELPRSAAALELSDTVQADLSKNRLSEIPVELCQFVSLEMLNLYHNCIRVIPDMVINLQMLTYLNLSRNQLSLLPPCLCALPLKVLIASNNKLVSLPENIGQLKCLMELDVSCNEITTLPQHIGQLQSLRELNIRRNYLHILPEELAELPLMKLDFSCNKVVSIPICFRNMRHLQIIELDNNPLQSPPAQICIKGKVHIFKYLNIEACRIDKTAESPYQQPIEKANVPQPVGGSIEDIYPDKKQDPDSGIGSDNGDKRLSATEPSDEDTGSLTIQMANISEEDQFHKQEDYLNIRSKQVEFDLEPKQLENDVEVEEDRDTALSSEFRTYMKGRVIEPEEPLRIEEDISWTVEQMQNTAQHLDTHPEVTENLSSPDSLSQEQQRLNENYEESSGAHQYPLRSETLVCLEMQASAINGRTPKVTSTAKFSSYQTESSIGELEFQRKREVMLEKTKHEAHLTFQRFDWNMSKQTANESMERNDSQGEDEEKTPTVTPTMSPTARSLTTPFGLKPRSVQSNTSSLDSLHPSFRKFTQANTEDSSIISSPKEEDRSDVFIRPTRHFESVDPQFTIRRKMEQMREEREHIEQLRENIETRLKVDLPEETGAALMDGVVLCHLVNHIRPRSVVSIHVPSPAVPKLSMAKCRRNVENFLEACRKMGVPEADLCSPYDILQSDVCGIQKTVGALLAHGENVQQSTHAILTWDLFGFCLFHTFFLMLLYITYNWSALM